MCGIAGWIGADPGDPGLSSRVAAALRHRGPDALAVRCWPSATLVHARLRIIDLTPTGAQPMSNEDGTVWTIFNGEMFNHREQRQWLENRGHAFRGRSDTEILPHLYEELGPDLFERLRGQFALAIFDVKRRRLLIGRDWFGIKPLFYAPSLERLAFASEINALRLLPGVDDRPSRQAIHDFAALTYIPAPDTFFRGIRSLEPGGYIVADVDGPAVRWGVHRYHRWVVQPDLRLSLGQATDHAERLIQEAVTSQLESDVPLGALLSGGVDSSLVCEAAEHALKDGVATFNVRFSDPSYDETPAAVLAARSIGSRHTTLEMDESPGTWDEVIALLRHAGQPFADTSMFAVHAVSRLMRRHVTVALSGDGGDEGFGGYDSYRRVEQVVHWQALPAAARSLGVGAASIAARGGVVPPRLISRLRELQSADDAGILEILQRWVRAEEHARLVRAADLLPVRRFFEPQWDHVATKGLSRLERLSAHNTEVNVRLRMTNDFLFKVDTASMRESLEVRVPLLDEKLFEFGMTLPHRLRVRGRSSKIVLRSVMARRFPRVLARKPKSGFTVPVDRWVTDEFRMNLRDYLLGPSARLPEYFRPEAYGPVIEAFCSRASVPDISRAGVYQRAILCLAVELFLREKAGGTA